MKRPTVKHYTELVELQRRGRIKIIVVRGVQNPKKTWHTESIKQGSQRLKWWPWSLRWSMLGPLYTCYVSLVWCCWVGVSLTPLPVLETHFPPSGLPHKALIWGFMASLFALVMSSSVKITWRSSFLKGNEEAVDVGESGSGRWWEGG